MTKPSGHLNVVDRNESYNMKRTGSTLEFYEEG